MKNKIKIFDTTLRDGDQSPGFHFLSFEKVKMARQLHKLGVDVIEAGFAASSEGDYKSITQICKDIGKENVIICSLSRAKDKDIETSAKALAHSNNPRIHTFIATSDIHINAKLRKSNDWVIEKTIEAVKKAKSYVGDVEFSCEDFGRSDKDYLVQVVSAAIYAGATTINLPDTVGWLTPFESYEKVKYVLDNVKIKGLDAVFSVHNHNDLGMATANTISGILAGASQVEVTINGIGERAGNTSLEEIVAILKTKDIGTTNINPNYIAETSRLCSIFTGVYPQPNKSIVGKNAFAHEAGIHQHGMINNRDTYEIMRPQDFGYESTLTFGARSGRNALRAKYSSLGYEFSEDNFERIYRRFKEFADDKKEITDEDLSFIVKSSK